MRNLLNYLRNPIPCQNERPWLWELIGLYFFQFLLIIPISIIIHVISKEWHLENGLVPPIVTHRFVLIAVVLAPVYEEVLFRSWLKMKRINAILFATTLLLFVVRILYGGKYVPAIILILLALGFLLLLWKTGRTNMEAYVSHHFKYFFYASSLLFGLFHAGNFSGNPYLILALAPILCGPQIVMGFILGFIRMRHGLVYSMLFHSAVNALGLYLTMKPDIIFSLL